MDLSEFSNFIKKNRKSVILSFSVMLVISIITSMLILNNPNPIQLNDFAAYHYASRMLVAGEFSRVYDQNNIIIDEFTGAAVYRDAPATLVYRYLPTMALYFMPIAFFSLDAAYIIFNTLNFVFNLLTVYLIFKTAKLIAKVDFGKNELIYYCAFFLLMGFQFENYFHGQVGALLAFLLVLSMYLYLQKKEFPAGLLLGLSFAIKPTTYATILLVLLMSGKIKVFLKRIAVMAIPMVPNILFFIQNPEMLYNFFNLNVSSGIVPVPSHAVSFVTLFINFFGYDKRMIFTLSLLAVFLVISFYCRKKYGFKNNILFSFVFGAVITFISQYDMWSHQLIYLLPFLIIFNLTAKSYYKPKLKRYILFMAAAEINSMIILLFSKQLGYITSIIVSCFMLYFYIDAARQMKAYKV